MRGWNRFSTFIFALLAAIALASSVRAGTLTVDNYSPIAGGGGLQITAHYSGISSDCCNPADIRFLQMITLTDPTTGKPKAVAPFPSSFIDPLPGQTIGSVKTDLDPWYDFTYTKNPLLPNPGAYNNGAGPYIYDRPAGWIPFSPISFSATTLVVCITASPTTDPDSGAVTAGTATILGGFNWGFTVTNNPVPPGGTSTTIMPITGVDPTSAALANAFQTQLNAFNTAGGTKWTLSAADNECCTLSLVTPTPSALYGVPVCLIGLAACRRWTKAAA